MKITEFLAPESVVFSLNATDMKSVVNEMCALLQKQAPQMDGGEVASILLDREHLSSTGIGEGVAIPHCRVAGLESIVAAFGISRGGIDFNSIDGKPTHLFFVLLSPENSAGIHLKALARISRLFKSPTFRSAIFQATNAKAIYDIIVKEDSHC